MSNTPDNYNGPMGIFTDYDGQDATDSQTIKEQTKEEDIKRFLIHNDINPSIVWHRIDIFASIAFAQNYVTKQMVVIILIGNLISIWNKGEEKTL